jgi:transposase
MIVIFHSANVKINLEKDTLNSKSFLYLYTMKLKAFKYRIYPTLEQKELIHQHFGCARWIYNYALNKKIVAFQAEKKSLSRFDIQAEIPSLKKDENTNWLKNVNSQTLQHIQGFLKIKKASLTSNQNMIVGSRFQFLKVPKWILKHRN